MGILDPDGFAGRRAAARSRRSRGGPSSRSTRRCRSSSGSRSPTASRSRTSPKRCSTSPSATASTRATSRLVAYGAAGPMLLPAALELLRVQRVVVPPHPGLFSALGLLSTDLVYYDSRSAYVVLAPEAAPPSSIGLRGDGARGCASGSASAPTASPSGAASTGGCSARAGRRRSSRCRDGPITEATIPDADRALPRRVRAPLRQSLPVRAGPGRHATACSSSSRPTRSSTSPARPATRHEPEPERARSSCATSPTSPSQAGGVRARDASRRAPRRGPGGHPRGAVDHARLPGPGRRGRPLRRDRHRGGMSATETDAPRRRSATSATRSSRPATAATASPRRCWPTASSYIVEHMCGRLLTAAFSPILRDFYDFAGHDHGAAGRSDYPTPAMSNSDRALHGHDDRLRAQHGRGVRRRAPRAGRRDRRQRPLPHAAPTSTTCSSCAPSSTTAAIAAFVNLQGAPARHGRRRPRRASR